MSAVTLVLPYPISANRYWASGVIPIKGTHPRKYRAITYVTEDARAYRDTVAKIAIAAGLRPLTGRVRFDRWLYPERPQDWAKRAQRDPDTWDDGVRCIDLLNADKVLADALNNVAWIDDKQIWAGEQHRSEPDEHGARIVVRIQPIVIVQPIAPDMFRVSA